mgnify:FL=1
MAEKLRKDRADIGRCDIVSVQGDFNKGDVLHIYDEGGEELARGMSNFTSAEILLLARNTDSTPSELLGYESKPRIIAADNMALIQDHHLTWEAPTDSVTLVG